MGSSWQLGTASPTLHSWCVLIVGFPGRRPPTPNFPHGCRPAPSRHRTIFASACELARHEPDCRNPQVEVAEGFPGAVPVRDSKDPHGPALVFGAEAWSAFVTGLKAGGFRTA